MVEILDLRKSDPASNGRWSALAEPAPMQVASPMR